MAGGVPDLTDGVVTSGARGVVPTVEQVPASARSAGDDSTVLVPLAPWLTRVPAKGINTSM